MKIKIIGFAIFCIVILGCQKDDIDMKSLVGSKGLNLYWDHKIFGQEGRGFIFSFSETERFENSYELVFESHIDNKRKTIDIYLTDKIDEGKCPWFPMPTIGDDNLCTSSGSIFIPENRLTEGKYNFTVTTSTFKIQSDFTINKDKVTLNIPGNAYFSSLKKEIFPTPRNLLYGGIHFQGEENTAVAREFFKKLESIGLKDTIVANPPFNLSVDETGKPEYKHWSADEHKLAFLYAMDVSFQTIFELAKIHFNKYDLNIYLFSSNGDQAFLNKIDGIVVEYAVNN